MNTVSEPIEAASNPGLVLSFQQRLVRQFQVQVADWLDTCRDLAAWEDRSLIDATPRARLAEHALMLDELERAGRWLATAADQMAADLGPIPEQIRLCLQDLQDTRAMWHGVAASARKEEILRDCFHEP